VNLIHFLLAAPTPTPAAPFDLNALLAGGTGTIVVGAVYYIIKLIFEKAIPSRSDSRANITILLEGLQSMVKVLQDEKAGDAKRLADRQARIDTLEDESETSFTRKAEMQAEIIELRARVAQKDRHIRQLVHMLEQLGATVSGLEEDTLIIILPAEDIAKLKKDSEEGFQTVG
jgi:chromosome segregation ATPase